MYKIACKRLGVKPNEVIYMDDSCGLIKMLRVENIDYKIITIPIDYKIII